MKTSVLKRLGESLDQYHQASYSKAHCAVLMGGGDYRDLLEEAKELVAYRQGSAEPLTVMGAGVNSDLRAGNRGWIIGSKTEIEKMRKQLIEAQYSEAFVRWFNDLHRKEQSIKKPDPINPSHYKSSKIEPIDYMRDQMTEEEFRGFLKGNIIKYTSRAEKKGGKEDYKKAAWYADKLAKL